MTTTRREFVRAGALAALGASILPADALGQTRPAPVSSAGPRRALRILYLGGTGFLGPHDVRAALSRGHEVTVFNRGRSGAGLFGDRVQELVGDRATDLEALKGQRWDAVVDESASLSSAPEWVKLSANLLRDSVDQYLFISTRSVYRDTSRVPMTSDAPVLTLENSPLAAGRPLPYGHAKAYAEGEAHAAMPGRVTVVRPGLIVGPGDDTDRFTYWPVKLAAGGEVLAPGDGSDRVQIVDVRDLADFVVTLIERRTYGTFNALSPYPGHPFDAFLEEVRKGVGGDPRLIWVDTEFLLANQVSPYGDLPVWQPARGRTAGFAQFDLRPELAAGLTWRPIEVTARETLGWWKTLPADRQVLRAGMKREREEELLQLWKASRG